MNTYYELYQKLAECYNTMNFRILEPYLAEDVVYESQWVFTPMIGSKNIIDYFEGEMTTMRAHLATRKIYAEIGNIQDNYCSGSTLCLG